MCVYVDDSIVCGGEGEHLPICQGVHAVMAHWWSMVVALTGCLGR